MISAKEKNVLLVRDEIGQSKPFTHDLPIGNHAFGKPMKKEAHGANALTSEW